ncbi:hypothetical protein PoB_002396600 [Plakobranchus ocellatus]|uniref:Uncharacterized protein n=1 Tax=Plakobranchus ocellatus TaxID=259542 RepID=A0AAV3ZDZ6_9GAST|nr:hypothetical protein PoB_002396600 [Plakobranchus ocellatus]
MFCCHGYTATEKGKWPGPNKYDIRKGFVWSKCKNITIKGKLKPRTIDPSVPGPDYNPCRDEWLQRPQTFGIKGPVKKEQYRSPGPGAYYPKISQSTGPKWQIRHLIQADNYPVPAQQPTNTNHWCLRREASPWESRSILLRRNFGASVRSGRRRLGSNKRQKGPCGSEGGSLATVPPMPHLFR